MLWMNFSLNLKIRTAYKLYILKNPHWENIQSGMLVFPWFNKKSMQYEFSGGRFENTSNYLILMGKN